MRKYLAIILTVLMVCMQNCVSAENVFSLDFDCGLPFGVKVNGSEFTDIEAGTVILAGKETSDANPRLSLDLQQIFTDVPDEIIIKSTMSSTADSFIYYVQNAPYKGSLIRLIKRKDGSLVLQYGSLDGSSNITMLLEESLLTEDFTIEYAIDMEKKTFSVAYNGNTVAGNLPFFVNLDTEYTKELQAVIFEHTGNSGRLLIKDITFIGDFNENEDNIECYIENLNFDVTENGIDVSGDVKGTEKAYVVSGIYKGDTLVNVKMTADEDFCITHNTADLSDCTAKVFVFDSGDSLSPLCTPYIADEKEYKTYSTIEARKKLLIEGYATKPFPDPYGENDENIGKIGYALSLFYLGKNDTLANEMLKSCLENCDAALGENSGIYFQMSILATIRIKYADRLTDENKLLCEKFFYEYLNLNSEVEKTKGVYAHSNNEYYMEGSGNHHVVRRQAFLHGAQILKNSEVYKDAVLSDGYTVSQHYDAWEKYWLDEIVYRIKYAPEVEFFSAGYGKYTLDCFFALYDVSESEKISALAKKYLDYIMADLVVQSTNGIYGGARGRSVRNTELGSVTDFFINMIYFNQNTEWALKGAFDVVTGKVNGIKAATRSHPNIMSMFANDYKPPFVLTNLALTDTEVIEYESYPLGAGDRNKPFTGYFVFTYPSYYRRYTYMTPTYTVGSMTYDRTKTYTEIQQQNRYVGIHFKNTENNSNFLRVFPETERNYSRGFDDIQSVASGSAMLVQSLSEAKYHDSTQHRDIKIAVSKVFYENHLFREGWMFSQTKDGSGYIAVKPSRGEIEGWSDEATETLSYLLVTKSYSPVVMQAGREGEFGSFEAFQDAVLKTEFRWETYSTFIYKPVTGGEKITFYTGKTLPKIADKTVSLGNIYNVKSPYFYSLRGSGKAVVKNLNDSCIIIDINVEGK